MMLQRADIQYDRMFSQLHWAGLRISLGLVLLLGLLSLPVRAEQAEQVVAIESLQIKDARYYLPGETAPFTGKAVSYFDDGMQKTQVGFRDGLKHGKEVAWYADGQLRYVVRYREGEPQSRGSVWYARSKRENVVASVLRVCGEADIKLDFCDPGLQETSRIELMP